MLEDDPRDFPFRAAGVGSRPCREAQTPPPSLGDSAAALLVSQAALPRCAFWRLLSTEQRPPSETNNRGRRRRTTSRPRWRRPASESGAGDPSAATLPLAGGATKEAGGGERGGGPAPVWPRGGAGSLLSVSLWPAASYPGRLGREPRYARSPGGGERGGAQRPSAFLLGGRNVSLGALARCITTKFPPGARRGAGPCGLSSGPLRNVAIPPDSAALQWGLGPRGWSSGPLLSVRVFLGSARPNGGPR